MRIHHIALWVKDLEEMKDFYTHYFQAKAGEIYHNPKKSFTSYFLRLDGSCSIEIMSKPGMQDMGQFHDGSTSGYAHIAISLGSKNKVDELTETFRRDGFTIAGEPRTTGDGYYESVILDPEQNRIEITE